MVSNLQDFMRSILKNIGARVIIKCFTKYSITKLLSIIRTLQRLKMIQPRHTHVHFYLQNILYISY